MTKEYLRALLTNNLEVDIWRNDWMSCTVVNYSYRGIIDIHEEYYKSSYVEDDITYLKNDFMSPIKLSDAKKYVIDNIVNDFKWQNYKDKIKKIEKLQELIYKLIEE